MSKIWAKSMNGPDELDCLGMMRALGALHSGTVELLVVPDGTGLGISGHLSATMRFTLLPGSALPPEVKVVGEWPNQDSRTIWGAVYMLLYRLDYAVSETYKSEALWDTPVSPASK